MNGTELQGTEISTDQVDAAAACLRGQQEDKVLWVSRALAVESIDHALPAAAGCASVQPQKGVALLLAH